MLTIRNAYVVNNEFVRKSKSTNEDEMLHPLQTNHPRRLVLYVVLLEIVLSNVLNTNRHRYDGEHTIRVWRSKASGVKRKKGSNEHYSTLYELQHGVQQPQQQVLLPQAQQQQQRPTKKKRKYIYRSLAELQIGTCGVRASQEQSLKTKTLSYTNRYQSKSLLRYCRELYTSEGDQRYGLFDASERDRFYEWSEERFGHRPTCDD